ncbi:Uncharacterised protein [Vibrio cholerae]|uniref:Uncharacterized protein n=1 Tax=Vibrio cholerae TaxID=666 RepID=A0A655XWS4_VIBCL|nr:Uncharacterised protein [Vibrio cholerae]
MSPSFNARPETMFSAQHRMSFTRLLKPRMIAKPSAPVIMPDPPMSAFIADIMLEGFKL